jgi:hypothetical protein
MFSLFWDQPVYRSYFAYDPAELQRRQSQRSRYLNYLENRLAAVLNDEFDEFWDSPPEPKQVPEQKPPAASATSDPKPQAPDHPPTPTNKPRTREYRFESSSTYNGKDYVEEHRERLVGDDGAVHERSRRRLGDRWYECENHTDTEGKGTQRETWHNVGDDEIESFKKEWTERHQPKAAIKEQPDAQRLTDGAGQEKHE